MTFELASDIGAEVIRMMEELNIALDRIIIKSQEKNMKIQELEEKLKKYENGS